MDVLEKALTDKNATLEEIRLAAYTVPVREKHLIEQLEVSVKQRRALAYQYIECTLTRLFEELEEKFPDDFIEVEWSMSELNKSIFFDFSYLNRYQSGVLSITDSLDDNDFPNFSPWQLALELAKKMTNAWCEDNDYMTVGIHDLYLHGINLGYEKFMDESTDSKRASSPLRKRQSRMREYLKLINSIMPLKEPEDANA